MAHQRRGGASSGKGRLSSLVLSYCCWRRRQKHDVITFDSLPTATATTAVPVTSLAVESPSSAAADRDNNLLNSNGKCGGGGGDGVSSSDANNAAATAASTFGGSCRAPRQKCLLQPPFHSSFSTISTVLLSEEIACIKDSWKFVQPVINQVLLDMFHLLFTENSDIKEKFFNFKNHAIEDLNKKWGGGLGTTTGFQKHVTRVSRAITKVVNHVDNLDKVTDYLKMLGKIHHQIGVEVFEVMTLGAYFVKAAKPHYSPEMRGQRKYDDSWLHFFAVVSSMMRSGFPSLEVEFDLTPEEKRCVQKTIPAILSSADIVGPKTIHKLFQTYPLSMIYFPTFRDRLAKEVTIKDPDLQSHGKTFVKFIGELVADIDEPEKNEAKLEALGRSHDEMGIPKQYLEAMGPIFVQAIRPVLLTCALSSSVSPGTSNTLWTRDTKPSWLRFFRVIALQMKRGYKTGPAAVSEEAGKSGSVQDGSGSGSTGSCQLQAGSLEASTALSPTSSNACGGGQYLLLSHSGHEGKKRLARQKMVNGSSMDMGSSRDPSAANMLISDSHAQRKAMFLKQHKQPRISLPAPEDSSCSPMIGSATYKTRRDGNILQMGKTFGTFEGSVEYDGGGVSQLGASVHAIAPLSASSSCAGTASGGTGGSRRDMRRGSSCEGHGANPFYLRARRRSDDSSRKKLSLDNQMAAVYL